MTEQSILLLDGMVYPFEEEEFVDDIQNNIQRAMDNLQSLDIKTKKSIGIFIIVYMIAAFFVCKIFSPKKKGKLKIQLRR